MNYIITKPLKSKSFAALLAFVPFGLFYSSIWGGIIMYFVVPIIIFFLVVYGNISLIGLVILIPIYFLICLIWSLIAVSNYNSQLILLSSQSYANDKIDILDETQIHQSVLDDVGNKKAEIYKSLEIIKGLYDDSVIDETEYDKQRKSLMKRLEVLNHNELSSETILTENLNYQPSEKSNALIWITGLVLLISLIILGYEKGILNNSLGDTHSNDKAAIKQQIDETYYGISNGAYTAQTIQGQEIKNSPFYDLNIKDEMVMGLAPLANLLGVKLLFKAKEIDIYEFRSDDTAKVKYTLTLNYNEKVDSANIDMEVIKIGGFWKLDGKKAFGSNKDQRGENKEALKYKNKRDSNKEDKYIDRGFLENSNNSASNLIKTATDTTEFQDESDEQFIIFDNKKIYMITNGKIEKILHQANNYMDDEYKIIETKEGYTFSEFGNITINQPNGEELIYETEVVPIDKVYIEDRYIQ